MSPGVELDGRRPGSPLVAICVWAGAWTLALASVLLALWFDLPREPLPVFLSAAPPEIRDSAAMVDVAVALVYAPVSALILWRRPHPVGVLLAVLSVGSGLAAFGLRYGLLGEQHDGLPLHGLLAFAGGWAFVPGTFVMAILPLLVRHDRLPTAHRGMVAACLTAGGLATLASMTQRSTGSLANPLVVPIDAFQDLLVPAYSGLSALALLLALVSCVVVGRRVVRAGPDAPAAMWWLVLGHGLLTLSYIAMATPAEANPPPWLVAFALIAPVASQVTYPAALLVVVLGQRLWGVEVAVNRVILWGALSASGVVLHLALVAVVSLVVPADLDVLWVLAPVAIVMVAQPLRRWLQEQIDALVYGESIDPADLLSVRPGAGALEAMCSELRRSLRVGRVALTRAGASSPLAVSGSAGPGEVRLTVYGGGRVLGQLEVSPVDGQRFDARTRRLLETVTGPVAAVWMLVDAHRELEAARAGVVEARAEERRVIRRDLHDGLGPALAGAGFGLAAAENLLSGDPAEAARILDEVAATVDRGAEDVRALAAAMVPGPEQAGLNEAITALAHRLATEELRIEVDCAVELATSEPLGRTAHLVAAEALTNAVRHARARLVRVEMAEIGDALRLTVQDDGAGIAPGAAAGIGTSSMRERAESLGGSLDVSTGPTGTAVVALLPRTGGGPVGAGVLADSSGGVEEER